MCLTCEPALDRRRDGRGGRVGRGEPAHQESSRLCHRVCPNPPPHTIVSKLTFAKQLENILFEIATERLAMVLSVLRFYLKRCVYQLVSKSQLPHKIVNLLFNLID